MNVDALRSALEVRRPRALQPLGEASMAGPGRDERRGVAPNKMGGDEAGARAAPAVRNEMDESVLNAM